MADIDISIIKIFKDECKLRQLFFDSAHPIGDIYVQYPQQKTPTELYNQNGVTSSWTEVDYSGAFFRANGGNAAAFINKTDTLTKQGYQNAYHRHTMAHTHDLSNHTHDLSSHTHSLSSHTHDLGNHTHTGNTMDVPSTLGNWRPLNGNATGTGAFSTKASGDNAYAADYVSGNRYYYYLDFSLSGKWEGKSSEPSTNTSGTPSNNNSGTPSNNTSGTPSNNTSGAASNSNTSYDGSSTVKESRPENFTIKVWKRIA